MNGAINNNQILVERISHKTLNVLERVERGKRAVNRREVKFYKYHKGITAILSVLGGLGLSQGKPSADFLSASNSMFLVGIVSLLVALALELYKAYNVEEVAIHAISAKDAFTLVEENLTLALQEDDPTDQLNIVVEESKALVRNFHKVLLPLDKDIAKNAINTRDHLITHNKGHWKLPKHPEGE